MTLIDAFKTHCTRMVRTRAEDGEGGWTTEWDEGGGFDAAIVLASATDARIAEAQGVTAVYTVTTDEELAFHDAFVRDSDGKSFRVTKVNDSTPSVASFQFNQYQAEEWSLA